ncbi:hypothetical protein ACTJIJ_19965 [Niabella sp. 22666]|uniref:hypothetical protein n=1 Tax=Niabella sp. 22666 TaxID=3453954 RepID=UPI003F83AA31
MRRLFSIALLFTAITATAQTPKTIKAAWEIQQADNTATNARIDSLIRVISMVGVKDPVIETPVIDRGDIEKLVNAYYTSSAAVVDGSGSITRLKANKGQDLPYVGLANPTIAKPYLAGGEVVFSNQPNANFKLLTRSNDQPFAFPEEITIVFRKMPGTDYEALLSGWGNYYLGFSSDNIRAGNSDAYLQSKAFPKYFELCYLHARYEATGITLWLNGRILGRVATTKLERRLGYGVGIETNSTDFNWIASMFIERGLTDQEREQYFKSIQTAYKIGTMPSLPYASEVKAVNQSGRLFASYQYNGANAEDKTKVQYQWWKLSPDLGSQKLISTESSIPYQSGVKVTVKVTDVKGNSWMFISGQYN